MPGDFAAVLAQNVHDLRYILPEVVAVATLVLALIFDLAVAPERRRSTAYVCILGLMASMLLLLRQNNEFVAVLAQGGAGALNAVGPRSIFSGMLQADQFGAFFKFLILLGTVVSLLLAVHAKELSGCNEGEFYLLLVAVCTGGLFLCGASNLLMIYLSLEFLSILSYAMAGFLRQDRKSAEAGIKYMVYGAMASGIMIFGMSYLYGLSGTLNIHDTLNSAGQTVPGIASWLRHYEIRYAFMPRGAIVVILAMVFAGFLYKIAAVPFHYWSPDVYEGAPTTATGFFSVVPKAAGFAVLIRVLLAIVPLGSITGDWLTSAHAETVMTVLAVVTMTVGNLAALGQTNAKRMLAYSSIAHAGYMLAGLAVLNTAGGAAAVLYYLIVYLFMNLGAFLVLIGLENSSGGCELQQLRGAVHREPLLVVALCIFLFSLTGLPPFGGFIGKYLIMLQLAERAKWGLILWIGINSLVSLYYYMKLAKTVAIDAPEFTAAAVLPTPVSYRVLAVGQSMALLVLFFWFEPVQRLCRQIMEVIR